MPSDQWYDDATREAATARVLQRRITDPKDRNVLTVVSEEFGVPRTTLATWVDEASPEAPAARKKPRPKFSQVVRTSKPAPPEEPIDDEAEEAPRAEPAEGSSPEPEADAGPDADSEADSEAQPSPERDADAEPAPEVEVEVGQAVETEPETETETETELAAEAPTAPRGWTELDVVSSLEAEVVALRSDNRALLAAMRVVLATDGQGRPAR